MPNTPLRVNIHTIVCVIAHVSCDFLCPFISSAPSDPESMNAVLSVSINNSFFMIMYDMIMLYVAIEHLLCIVSSHLCSVENLIMTVIDDAYVD